MDVIVSIVAGDGSQKTSVRDLSQWCRPYRHQASWPAILALWANFFSGPNAFFKNLLKVFCFSLAETWLTFLIVAEVNCPFSFNRTCGGQQIAWVIPMLTLPIGLPATIGAGFVLWL